MAQIDIHEIQVRDKAIHCAGCEARIQSVLAKMPGVDEVKADHKTQKTQQSSSCGRKTTPQFVHS